MDGSSRLGMYYRLGAQEAASNSLKPGNLSLVCILLAALTISPPSSSLPPLGGDEIIFRGGRMMGGEPDLDAGTDDEYILLRSADDVSGRVCADRDDGHDVFLGGTWMGVMSKALRTEWARWWWGCATPVKLLSRT